MILPMLKILYQMFHENYGAASEFDPCENGNQKPVRNSEP